MREIVGWLLLFLGTALWLLIVLFLLNDDPDFISASVVILPAFVLFRGGIHLLKVAAAVRVCLEAERREPPALPPAPSGSKPARDRSHFDW